MKVRNGYVTNSSSTSFIISLKEDWKKDNFMSAVGADGISPMNLLFEDLFDTLDREKEEIHRVIQRVKDKKVTVSQFLEEEQFDKETIEIVESLIEQGRTIYYGQLESGGNTPAESYFCCRSFILCDDDIYFNGSIGGW